MTFTNQHKTRYIHTLNECICPNIFFTSLLLLAAQALWCQTIAKPLIAAIKEADLKKDMYELAADAFKGRETGTLDELKAAAWLADKAEKTGMQPAGDNGTWFQYFNIYRHVIAPYSKISLGNKNYELWNQVLVAHVTPAAINAPIVFINDPTPQNIAAADITGKVVAIQANGSGIKKEMFLFERRYPGFIRNKYYDAVNKKGAAALIIIADEQAEASWRHIIPQLTRGLYGVKGLREKADSMMPVFWLHQLELDNIKSTKENFITNIYIESYTYPSVNIVGKITGIDAALKNEFVLLSGHHDHDGIREDYSGDTIYNGADDNASTCVAMLAIAKAFKKQPAKRSILFVFHGAEERGLLGSRWYAAYPTVNRSSIIAVLNGDMIGSNNIDTATLLGATPPHQNSIALVKAAMKANNEGPQFKLDTSWDMPEHPEYFYFRSDHLPYARLGIPSVFYTSMLHNQYHTPMDNAENINYKKLYKMTEWIYRTAWIIANDATKPDTIPNVKLER